VSCVISQAVKAPVAQAASEIPAAKEETTGDGMDASLLPEGERTEKGEMN
jgi:hypothetical protein